jgi:membrane-bound lytic murein transglycosylase B
MMTPMKLISTGLLIAFCGLIYARDGTQIQSGYADRDDVQAFIKKLHDKYGMPEQSLRGYMSYARRQESILALMRKPAEGKDWSEYRPIFLTNKRIQAGLVFWDKHLAELQRAEKKYGIPPEIIVAIIGVETFYGTRMGRFSVLDALTTLGFDYPPRSAFFKSELEHFLLLVREEKIDPLNTLGSYAGAMGMGQFIPSSYRRYTVDFDADGKRDLWRSPADGIGSVANYFKAHKWKPGEPIIHLADVRGKAYMQLDANDRKPRYLATELEKAGVVSRGAVKSDEKLIFLDLHGESGPEQWVGHHNFFVITEYNHSVKYALAVYQLGEAIKLSRKNQHSG